MTPAMQSVNVSRRMAEICAAGAGLLALATALIWTFGAWNVAGPGREHLLMAPSTAWLMFLLSGSVLLHRRWPSRPAICVFAFFAVFSVGTMTLLTLGQSLGIPSLHVERWLAPAASLVGTIPVRRMSPLTGPAFLSTAFAFLLQLPPFTNWRISRQAASALATVTLLVSLGVLVSYAAGVPALYERQVFPMALLTTVTFVLLNFALLAAAGHETWLFVPAKSRSGVSAPSPPQRYAIGPTAASLCLLVAIGASGSVYLRHQLAQSRQKAENELLAIGDLKVREISRWHHERLGDAGNFFEMPWVSESVKAFQADPSATKPKEQLLAMMASAQKNFHYARVLLFDGSRQVRLAVPADKGEIDPRAASFVDQALRTRQVLVSDLHLSPVVTQGANMDIFVPVLTEPSDSGEGQEAVGVLMFEIDPQEFLFPVIQTWPAPSRTAETLIVRREGNDVVFLNELRHQKNTALSLRFSMESQPFLPAAMAVAGREGIVEGVDYRGVPVLAAVRSIPETPWFMVAKVDQEEVFAPLREQTRTTGSIILVLILASALGVNLLWRQRDNQWLRRQLDTERERQALAERIMYLNKCANDIILSAGQDWTILEANDRAVQAYGYSLKEMQRLTVWDLCAPEVRAKLQRGELRTEAENGAVLETIHQRSDGSLFPVESSMRTIRVGETVYHQAIIRDITERKRQEEERANFEARVQQAQKLESLGVLAGGIAHDFNNLLAVILGHAELASQDLPETSPARPSIEEIDKAAKRAAELCKQMLAYSGKGKFIVTPVDLSELVHEMGRMLDVSISKKAVLRYNLTESLPPIEADATQIRQVVMNLIVNASEAIGNRSGVISAATGLTQCDREYLQRTQLGDGLSEGPYVYIEIADSGAGMDADTLGKVFEPFFTTKFTGRGLGLAAVLGIVRGHKGAIDVRSEVGRGTTFKVLFPALTAAAAGGQETGAAETGWRGTGTVLLVDDDGIVRALAKKMLERLGFTVMEAADGREGLGLYRKHADDIACVFLDLTMPHMDGEETFRELRNVRPGVRVVMSSGYDEHEVASRFAGAGVAGFIQKPYGMADLAAVMKSVLGG